MRNPPVWILNLGLALILFIVLMLVFFTRWQIPSRESLAPISIELPRRQVASSIDVRRIYENDLFKTYHAPTIEEKKIEEPMLIPPPSPVLKIAPQLQPPRIQFLEPLKISLKGIVNSSNGKETRAIIADDKTQKENIYAVSDSIEDAEIIRIDSNKVIFIRSNGQQEIIFLTRQEALNDSVFKDKSETWNDAVHKKTDQTYVIDHSLLKERLPNPVLLIEMLDLTTAMEKEVSVGCHIGQMPTHSIGHSLGLQYGDVITSINDMPVATTKERSLAYQQLKALALNMPIRVKLIRNNQKRELIYLIQENMQKLNQEPTISTINVTKKLTAPLITSGESNSPPNFERASKKIFDAPVDINKIRTNDRVAMRNASQSAALQRTRQIS